MTYLMSDDLFADSSDLHFGLRTFVLGDGEVQTYVDDGQQEEGKEGRLTTIATRKFVTSYRKVVAARSTIAPRKFCESRAEREKFLW